MLALLGRLETTYSLAPLPMAAPAYTRFSPPLRTTGNFSNFKPNLTLRSKKIFLFSVPYLSKTGKERSLVIEDTSIINQTN